MSESYTNPVETLLDFTPEMIGRADSLDRYTVESSSRHFDGNIWIFSKSSRPHHPPKSLLAVAQEASWFDPQADSVHLLGIFYTIRHSTPKD